MLKIIVKLAKIYYDLRSDSCDLRFCDYMKIAAKDLRSDSSTLEFMLAYQQHNTLVKKINIFKNRIKKKNIFTYDSKGKFYSKFNYIKDVDRIDFYAGKGVSDIVYEFDINKLKTIPDRCYTILNNCIDQALCRAF
jgi:hypothetical protein